MIIDFTNIKNFTHFRFVLADRKLKAFAAKSGMDPNVVVIPARFHAFVYNLRLQS